MGRKLRRIRGVAVPGTVASGRRMYCSLASCDAIDVCSVLMQRLIVQVPPPVKATSEYVNFLLAVASDPASSVAQVLASMAPCMRLYAFLGKVIQNNCGYTQ